MPRVRPKPSSLSAQSQEARRRALDALALMREHGLSMTKAAKRAGTKPETMKRHLGPTILKKPDGQYRAKAWDRIPRRMRFLTNKGQIEIEVRDSRSAARIARYWTALDQALKKGEWWRLRPFVEKPFTYTVTATPSSLIDEFWSDWGSLESSSLKNSTPRRIERRRIWY